MKVPVADPAQNTAAYPGIQATGEAVSAEVVDQLGVVESQMPVGVLLAVAPLGSQ